ncbi:hypothetical protein GCM10014719_48380 [Planomonospora parontospora subsp. antibiotica]|nr:hypothetical protein GCM10014719_48380 [Planomonospora parontospora subsp. antibiotica]GII17967.1 hypothetical protein Ppa05_46930 [Planomonospora parontospora subsp. antibiotica]
MNDRDVGGTMSGSARRPAVHRLLLIVVTLGVAAMHTLGHAEHGAAHGGGGDGSSVTGHALLAGPAQPQTHPLPLSPVTAHAGHGTSDLDGGLPPLDPTSVCLAVLTGLLLLLLTGAASPRRRRTTAEHPAARLKSLTARPPPRRTALRLARLSVLRI